MFNKPRIFTTLVIILSLTSCDSSSSNNKSNNNSSENFYGSYEAKSSCTTGRHTFTASSENEILTAFCDSLKNDSLNNNCAWDQRKSLFQNVQCPGDFSSGKSSGSVSIYSLNYAYNDNGCFTGNHFFTASTEKAVNEIYCKALQDETLNRGCSKSKRDNKFSDMNCSNILK